MASSNAAARRRHFDAWPGYVDVLSTLLMVVIFVLMVFVIAQVFLSKALTGREEALAKLTQQVAELGDLLALEKKSTQDLRVNLGELSSQLQASTAARDQMQQRLTVVLGERDQLASSLADANAALAKSDQERSKLQADIAALQEASKSDQAALAEQRAEADKAYKTAADQKAAMEAKLVELENAYKTIDASKEKIQALLGDIAALESLRDDMAKKLLATQEGAQKSLDEKNSELIEERKISESARLQLEILNRQILALRDQLATVSAALDASEAKAKDQEVQIADLGKRLNVALANKVAELASYRSEFFGKLREVLGNRPDIQVVGDRFVFQSEVLFDVASADIGEPGKEQLAKFAQSLIEIGAEIPPDIDWILRVDGHTDTRPIRTPQFDSNWELSAARAIAVVKFLVAQGVPPSRLVAAGFGEYRPLDPTDDEIGYRRNRRIELKLDQR
jgi:chemotaxis protein MotB